MGRSLSALGVVLALALQARSDPPPLAGPRAAELPSLSQHDRFVPLAPPGAVDQAQPSALLPCCRGPAPCVPQYLYGHHYSGGFLYYGTFPYDDDWFNNFSGCCRDYPECAQCSTAAARWWINLHNRCPGPAYRLSHDPPALYGQKR